MKIELFGKNNKFSKHESSKKNNRIKNADSFSTIYEEKTFFF